MIYITGDTHIPVDIGKLSARCFPEQKEMTKSDYVIICDDFGANIMKNKKMLSPIDSSRFRFTNYSK